MGTISCVMECNVSVPLTEVFPAFLKVVNPAVTVDPATSVES
jgi:hypothetical protein